MSTIYHFDRLFPNNTFYPEDEITINKIFTMIQNGENLDIRNIAEKNYTSISSISRLVKRTGLKNYKEFIYYLQQIVKNKTDHQLSELPFATTTSNWEDIGQQLQTAFKEKKVFLFGEGFCQFLVSYTYRKLLLKRIYAVDLNGVEISTVSDETPYTLITFSHSGENKRGLIKMHECKQYGGKVIAITAASNSSYQKESDYCIIVDSNSNTTDYENKYLNYFFGNTLNLMEYLIDSYVEDDLKTGKHD